MNFAALAQVPQLSPEYQPHFSKKAGTSQQLPGWKAIFSWNTTTMSWDSTYYSTYQYNANGLVTERVDRVILGFGTLSQDKVEFQYNGNGDQVEALSYSYSFTNNSYTPEGRNTQTYDGQNNITALTDFSYNAGNWDTTFSQANGYAYRPNNQILRDTTSFWIGSGMGFAPNSLRENSYNAANEIESSTFLGFNNGNWDTLQVDNYVWDNFGQELHARIETAYYSNGQVSNREKIEYDRTIPNVVVETYFEWANGAYSPLEREIHKFDLQGNPILESYEEYLANAWEPAGQDTFLNSYTATDQLTEVIAQELDLSTNIYENYGKINCGNFSVSRSAPVPTADFVTIFPNPSAGKVQVQLELQKPTLLSYAIADLQGRMLRKGQLSHPGGKASLDLVADMPRGTYLYWISAEGKRSHGKLVVQ